MTSGISIYATYEYLASNIDYTKQGTNTTIKVSEALDELYQNSKETSDETKSITSNGEQTLDKYYKNINVNVTTDKVYTQAQYDAKTVAQTKTLLWTNSNPSSTFNAADITLNSSLANFTHILIQFKNHSSGSIVYDDIFKLSPSRSGQGEQAEFLFGVNNGGATVIYVRRGYVKSNTQIHIGGGVQREGTNVNDDRAVPIAIYGLNFTY